MGGRLGFVKGEGRAPDQVEGKVHSTPLRSAQDAFSGYNQDAASGILGLKRAVLG